jgi:hypothetical protein
MNPDTRTPISDAVKASITDAFKVVPSDKRGALLLIGDEHGARLMTAAKFGDHWKVGGGVAYDGKVSATVAIVGAW